MHFLRNSKGDSSIVCLSFLLTGNGSLFFFFLSAHSNSVASYSALRQECMMESKDESPDRSESRKLKGLR